MPVDFLSAAQVAAYGRYAEPLSVAQLERFFHFDERDRMLIDRRRGDHNRLGFAVQLGTVRFLGTFLARPAEVPEVVARRVAEELAVGDPACLAEYAQREPTHREHAGEIQREYGYRDFSEVSAQAELLEWLDARAWTTAERPSVLFDLATARLIETKVLFPGATVLARAVASARDRAAARLYRTLADAITGEQQRSLEELLQVPVGEQLSRLEVLRAGPRKLTATEVAEAFARLAEVREVGVGSVTIDVPAGRLRTLARYGLGAKAQTLRRMSPQRRTATLLAALWQLELDATDDALIVLTQVTDLLLSQATREHKDRRYAQLPELDRAARRLRAAVLVLLDPPPGGLEELWSAIAAHASRGEQELAADTVHRLASEPDVDDGQDAAFRGELLRRYQSLRRFLPTLLEVVSFDAAPAGRPVIDALESLRALEGRSRPRQQRLGRARCRGGSVAPARARKPAARGWRAVLRRARLALGPPPTSGSSPRAFTLPPSSPPAASVPHRGAGGKGRLVWKHLPHRRERQPRHLDDNSGPITGFNGITGHLIPKSPRTSNNSAS